MHPLIDLFYRSSPVFIQNSLISLYGLHLSLRRYGSHYREYRDFLAHSQWSRESALDNFQAENLRAVLEHAYRNVPFYRDVFHARRITPDDIRTAGDLTLLPVTDKDAIRKDPDRFISREFDRRRLIPIHTSGTTGTPMTFYFTREAIQRNYAFFARFLEGAGVRMGERSATFAGRVFIPQGRGKPPFWRSNWKMRNVLFSSYHISERTLPFYIARLEELDPVFIDSYPSAIHTIARFIKDKGIRHGIAPRAIVTSSETLFEHQREAIEGAFRCRVYDQYGNAEMAAFISQCEKGTYHANPEYGIVEVIGRDGEPKFDEPGELVCTGFLNHAMPLIRYRIGDSAVLSREPCACGRRFPVVKALLGRADDVIVTKDGRMVGRLDPVFKGLSTIKEAQIVQEDSTTIVLRVVKGEHFAPREVAMLAEELKKRLGPDMAINTEFVAEIPRTSSGKFRSVVSRIAPGRG